MALLDVRNIRRHFGGVIALDDVSFQVQGGRIKGLIGPNGAGKTTLFNVVSGVLQPDEGTVLFNDRVITGLKPFRIAERGIARTFQNPSLFLKMTVLQNVMVGRHVRSKSEFLGCALRLPGQRREERAIRDAAMECLEFVGLADKASLPAGSLAFGQRRMVELARAMATEPALILLDEPASGLNSRETVDLGILVRAIRERGITILIVEHDMSMVMDLSDEILVLHNGARIAEGSPDEIQNDPHVISVYLGGGFEHAPTGNQPPVRV
jgi:ABC-type branched-subunit amino acid transport system ATPase component